MNRPEGISKATLVSGALAASKMKEITKSTNNANYSCFHRDEDGKNVWDDVRNLSAAQDKAEKAGLELAIFVVIGENGEKSPAKVGEACEFNSDVLVGYDKDGVAYLAK